MKSGKIILQRQKNLNGLFLDVQIYIDNKLTDTITSGGQKEFNIDLGRHIIKVQQHKKIGEQEINVNENETTTYSFRPNRISLISFISPVIAIALFYLYDLSLILTGLLLLPGVATAIYSLTSGRKKYFVFEVK